MTLIVVVALLAPATCWAAPRPSPRAAPVVGADFRISVTDTLTDEHSAVVAANATTGKYLVVWERQDGTTGASEIYGQMVNADGSLLAEEFLIRDPARTRNPQEPAVTATSTGYLVVWSNQVETDARRDIYGQRLSAAGALVGSAFRISGPGGSGTETMPAVVWSGTESLVVWVDDRNYEERGADIYGHRVADDGTRPGSDFRISGTNAVQHELEPAVAWNGTSYLVVWEDDRDYADRGVDVRGRRVTAAGEPQGRDFRVSSTTATADDFHPGVASDGTGYLVVWADWRLLPGRQTDIYGRLVSAAGRPVGANFRVCGPGATGWDWTPAVDWDGLADQFLVVWQDERNWSDRGSDIYGRRVAGDGSRVGGDFRISGAAPTWEYAPAVAWSGAQHLVVWQDSRAVADHGRDIWGRRADLDGA